MSRAPQQEQRRCVYCLQRKLFSPDESLSEFDTEHVIHKALSKGFQGNLTLKGSVCADCNDHFDKNLDRTFTRSSYIGFLRFEHGLKDINEQDDFDKETLNPTAVCPEEPNLHGSELELVKGEDGKVRRRLRQVVQLELQNGDWLELTEEQIDRGQVPNSSELGTSYRMVSETIGDQERIFRKLIDLGLGLARGKVRDEPVKIAGTSDINEVHYRSLAKIAFNYLVKVCERLAPEIAFFDCFDESRRYVRYGTMPALPVVTGQTDRLLWGETKDCILTNGHLVALDLEETSGRRSVVAYVSPFNQVAWRVVLARCYDRLHYSLASGHHWDLDKKICKPLVRFKSDLTLII